MPGSLGFFCCGGQRSSSLRLWDHSRTLQPSSPRSLSCPSTQQFCEAAPSAVPRRAEWHLPESQHSQTSLKLVTQSPLGLDPCTCENLTSPQDLASLAPPQSLTSSESNLLFPLPSPEPKAIYTNEPQLVIWPAILLKVSIAYHLEIRILHRIIQHSGLRSQTTGDTRPTFPHGNHHGQRPSVGPCAWSL